MVTKRDSEATTRPVQSAETRPAELLRQTVRAHESCAGNWRAPALTCGVQDADLETRVVSAQKIHSLQQYTRFAPSDRKRWRALDVPGRYSMQGREREPRVWWANQHLVAVTDPAVLHADNTNGTNARALTACCFKV
jgi:hypothetical protein